MSENCPCGREPAEIDLLRRLAANSWLATDCDCDPCVLSRCLRLLLGVAEEIGMPTSRADAIHSEVMSAVVALEAHGRDMDVECAAALDAVQDELDGDDGDNGDEEDSPEPEVPVSDCERC